MDNPIYSEGGSCLKDRRKEVLKRIEKRKKYKRSYPPKTIESERNVKTPVFPEYQEQHDFTWFSTNEGMKNTEHPLFNREIFLFKILASACLVLIVAIAFKNQSQQLEPVRSTVTKVMEKEFQFAMVADWYEDTFGKPLALFPEKAPNKKEAPAKYALPANGVILEDFQADNQGVTIQTVKGEAVEAIQSGVVKFAGVDKEFGKTIIIQHPDQSETWYGQLGAIKVKAYDKVQAGDQIGVVSSKENETTGEFYFAIKQDEKFIDPVQVIKFE